MEPIDIEEVYSDKRGHRKMFQLLHQRIKAWSQYVETLLGGIASSRVSEQDLSKLRHLYDVWLEVFTMDYLEQQELPMCIFLELSRTWFLIHYNDLVDEQQDIQARDGVPDPTRSYKILWKPTGEEQDKRVIMYTQQDVYNALLDVSEQLNYMVYTEADELKKLVDLLLLRYGVFFCEELPKSILGKFFFCPTFFAKKSC